MITLLFLLKRFMPSPASGEFGFFSERVLNGESELLESASNTTLDDDETKLISGVQNNDYAIGFMGYTHYAERTSDLSLLAINNIRPDLAIENGEPYLLARPLNLYTDVALLQQKPQLAAFIAFQLKHGDEYLAELNYVALNSLAKEHISRDLLRALHESDSRNIQE